MDELAHIPAGFSYLYQNDYRLNPEHPPLIKDLAAIPLMSLNLNFPENHPSWRTGVNNQWWFGNQFMFKSQNNPDQIMFLARIPMIIVMILFCLFIFFYAKKLVGPNFAILALIFSAFSPTILAHGRLVTTDVGAAFGAILATYFWIYFLKDPSLKNLLYAGVVLGASMLVKFSLILLIPFFAILTILWPILKEGLNLKEILKYLAKAILAGIVAVVLIIWPFYYFHTFGYPQQKQIADTEEIVASNPWKPLKNLCLWMTKHNFTRPLAHYLLGLLMATQRVSYGNTVYFLGTVSGGGIKYYFPLVYLMKIPLALIILMLFLLIFFFSKIKNLEFLTIKKFSLKHFDIVAFLIFLAIYWFTSIGGNLNIGVRHLLPVFPFTYLLLVFGVKSTYESLKDRTRKIFLGFLVTIILWYVLSSLLCFPHYLTYFNEAFLGPKNGYKYVVDSNYDWGQDLKRLQEFVKKNNIQKIYVDYFGGDDVEYRLGEKWVKFDPRKEKPIGWFAVSATFLQGGRGKPIRGFNQPTGYYRWLDSYIPITRAGNSIFIYYIPSPTNTSI
jgi:4-amino-4-deoxy-L-arabinose transferase-like glycosyltransferase